MANVIIVLKMFWFVSIVLAFTPEAIPIILILMLMGKFKD